MAQPRRIWAPDFANAQHKRGDVLTPPFNRNLREGDVIKIGPVPEVDRDVIMRETPYSILPRRPPAQSPGLQYLFPNCAQLQRANA